MADNYWTNRNEEMKHIQEMFKTDAAYNREIKRIYERSLDDIKDDIDTLVSRYAGKEALTMSEARKAISKTDVEKFGRKAKRYVKERNFTERANYELRLYNATMRMNRLDLLQQEIRLELIAMANDEEKLLISRLDEEVKDEITRQSGILGATVPNQKRLKELSESILFSDFNGTTFSERIWTNQADLQRELEVGIRRTILQGQNPRVAARNLKGLVNTAMIKKGESASYVAERLAITESARVQSLAQKVSFEENDIEEYDFIEEPGACENCKKIARNGPYKVKKMQPGVNAAPIHPFCRCSEAARVSREELETSLTDRGL